MSHHHHDHHGHHGHGQEFFEQHGHKGHGEHHDDQSYPAPQVLHGSWADNETLTEICRIKADGVRPGEMRLINGQKVDENPQAIWAIDGSGSKVATMREGAKGKKTVIGTFQCANKLIVWENKEVWRRSPNPKNPQTLIVMDVGGAVVRVGQALTSPKVGHVKRYTRVLVAEAMGRRVRMEEPLQGWISTNCVVLGSDCQICLPIPTEVLLPNETDEDKETRLAQAREDEDKFEELRLKKGCVVM